MDWLSFRAERESFTTEVFTAVVTSPSFVRACDRTFLRFVRSAEMLRRVLQPLLSSTRTCLRRRSGLGLGLWEAQLDSWEALEVGQRITKLKGSCIHSTSVPFSTF